jgi:hypothetical protein
MLQGKQASLIHNGGAYGDGPTESGVGVEPEQRAQLESVASSRSLPSGLVNRVRIVLLSAAGKMNYATHKHPRVKRWLSARHRFHVHQRNPSPLPRGGRLSLDGDKAVSCNRASQRLPASQ